MWLYWCLMLFYVALMGYELTQQNYGKVLYWGGAIVLTVGILKS